MNEHLSFLLTALLGNIVALINV